MARLLILILSFTVLAGCQTSRFDFNTANPISGLGGSAVSTGLYREGLPGTASWAVLPFANNTEAKNVTMQVERILMVQLPSKGVESARLYPEAQLTTASDTLSGAHKIQSGKQWAKQNGISFGIAGEIHEWDYDDTGRPKVALNLVVVDVRTGEVIWNSDGSSEGRQGESLYDISRVLMSDLLQSLPINRRI